MDSKHKNPPHLKTYMITSTSSLGLRFASPKLFTYPINVLSLLYKTTWATLWIPISSIMSVVSRKLTYKGDNFLRIHSAN